MDKVMNSYNLVENKTLEINLSNDVNYIKIKDQFVLNNDTLLDNTNSIILFSSNSS